MRLKQLIHGLFHTIAINIHLHNTTSFIDGCIEPLVIVGPSSIHWTLSLYILFRLVRQAILWFVMLPIGVRPAHKRWFGTSLYSVYAILISKYLSKLWITNTVMIETTDNLSEYSQTIRFVCRKCYGMTFQVWVVVPSLPGCRVQRY